jgi:hypothetical protein
MPMTNCLGDEVDAKWMVTTTYAVRICKGGRRSLLAVMMDGMRTGGTKIVLFYRSKVHPDDHVVIGRMVLTVRIGKLRPSDNKQNCPPAHERGICYAA